MDMTIEFIYWKYPLNSNYICAVTIRLLLNVSDLDCKKDPPQHLQQDITIQPSHSKSLTMTSKVSAEFHA